MFPDGLPAAAPAPHSAVAARNSNAQIVVRIDLFTGSSPVALAATQSQPHPVVNPTRRETRPISRIWLNYGEANKTSPPFRCEPGATRSGHPVLEVRDTRGLDGTDLLELHLRVSEVVEEASTVAEQHGNDVELELVEQSRRQVLLNNVAAAPENDVFARSGRCRWE